MTTYPHEFYASRDEYTRHAAETILGLALEQQMTMLKSAVDVGCGVGTWLSVLKDKYGFTAVQGYDGPWVGKGLLQIPQDCFEAVALDSKLPPVTCRYDLAISLEVAEHISKERASWFVECLCAYSDTVLFSAAIPGQGGTGHVNEQWPTYWAELFAERGYSTTDSIRRQIWDDPRIPFWYRQNTLLFTKGVASLRPPMNLVHPELFTLHARPGVKGSVRKVQEAVLAYVT